MDAVLQDDRNKISKFLKQEIWQIIFKIQFLLEIQFTCFYIHCNMFRPVSRSSSASLTVIRRTFYVEVSSLHTDH